MCTRRPADKLVSKSRLDPRRLPALRVRVHVRAPAPMRSPNAALPRDRAFSLSKARESLKTLGALASKFIMLLEDHSTLFHRLIGIDVRYCQFFILPDRSRSGQDALAIGVYRGGAVRRTAVVAVADLRRQRAGHPVIVPENGRRRCLGSFR